MTKARWRLVATLAVLSMTLALPGTSNASFAGVVNGSLTLTSEPGEWIGQGQSFFVDTASSFSTHGDGTTAHINVGEWNLTFAAPPGQQLVPGSYTGATRAAFRGPGEPGLDVNGLSRGCNTVAGSFTVLDATYGPFGYLQSFHATFEQRCDGFDPALRGEINVTSVPAPPPVAVHLTFDPVVHLVRGGGAAVHGTVWCNQTVNYFVPIRVIVTQNKKVTTSGTNFGGVENGCDTTPKPWQITVWSDYRPNFDVGTATITADTSVPDDWYSQYFDYNPSINATDLLTQTRRLTNG